MVGKYPQKKYDRHATVRIPKSLLESVEEFLRTKEAASRGLHHKADVVTAAVREFLEERGFYTKPAKPPLEHYNLNDNGVIIIDRIINPGRERYVQIYFKPEGILCEFCQSDKCYHIHYAYTKEDIKEVLRKHYREGWKIPDPDNPEVWWGCPDLNRGPESPSGSFSGFLIDWDVLMDDFWDWVDSRGLNPEYAEKIIRLLERFSPRIRGVRDVIRLFSGVSQGVRHNLVNAVRNLFNYCELIGYPKWWLDQLRRALPKDRVGVDLKVPSEGEILDSLSRLNRIPFSHQAFWLLLLDSGLRRCEAAWLINNRREIREKFEFHGKFVCVWLGLFRRSKQAFYGYMTPQTYDLIMQVKGEVKPDTAGHYFSKFNFVTPKYLRKFVFDKMLELGVPESVADFIEGRAPKTVGARHYTKLKRQADHYYPKYVEYLEKLNSL